MYRKKINIKQVFCTLTSSSGTFSHSPFVVAVAAAAALSSFLDGFCLSFLLNENDLNDQRFLTFSFFGLALLSASPVPFSSATVVSFSFVAACSSLFVPFSTVLFVSSSATTAASGFVGITSPPPSPPLSGGFDICSFSVAISFSFSASSVTTFSLS